MASLQSWDESPAADGSTKPMRVPPPPPPPKDDFYVPKLRSRQRTEPVRKSTAADITGSANSPVRPPLSRYSTYSGAELAKTPSREQARPRSKDKPSEQTKDKPSEQAKEMPSEQFAPRPATVVRMKTVRPLQLKIKTAQPEIQIHVTTNITTRSSPLANKGYSSIDQLAQTFTSVQAGKTEDQVKSAKSGDASDASAPKLQTVRAPQSGMVDVPILQNPPLKAKSAQRTSSISTNQDSPEMPSSKPTSSRPSAESARSAVSKMDQPAAKPSEPETDSDVSSLRTSSSFERLGGKSTRSSSISMIEAKAAARHVDLNAPEKRNSIAHSATDSVSALPNVATSRTRRSSCSSIPVVSSPWNPAISEATAEDEPQPAKIDSPQAKDSYFATVQLINLPILPAQQDQRNKLRKTKRWSRSSPMLREDTKPSRSESRAESNSQSEQASLDGDAAAPKQPKNRTPLLAGLLSRKSKTAPQAGLVPTEPEPPLPDTKRISMTPQTLAVATALSQQPGASYSVTCTSEGRSGEAKRSRKKLVMRKYSDAAPALGAPYTPGLRQWDDAEFQRWVEEEGDSNKPGPSETHDQKLQREMQQLQADQQQLMLAQHQQIVGQAQRPPQAKLRRKASMALRAPPILEKSWALIKLDSAPEGENVRNLRRAPRQDYDIPRF